MAREVLDVVAIARGLKLWALAGSALLALGGCIPDVPEKDAQQPIMINSVSAPPALYLTQTAPVTISVGGTAGKTATWTIASPAGGGSFSPASGVVTIDSSNAASISTTYIAPTTGPGGSYTSQLTLVRDSNFTATADIPITLIQPTVAIASVSAPAFLPDGATTPVTITLSGAPNFQVSWTLTPAAGTFVPSTATVLLDGSGNASVNGNFTLTAGTPQGSYTLNAGATLTSTGYAAPTVATTITSIWIALFAKTNNDFSVTPCAFGAFTGGFVDYCPAEIGSEASNLGATLKSQGFTVTPFTGITAADFATATSGRAVLALPEMEQASLGTALLADPTATSTIVNWVNGGGVLMVFDPYDTDGINWLNSAFGFSLGAQVPTGSGGNLGTAATGTPFAGGPATIPWNSDTETIPILTLPAGSKAIYVDSVSGDAIVSVIPYFAGRIVIFGWDWFDAAPTGAMDGGWLSVIQTAVAAALAGTL